eukprot:6963571-Lingulodinium_polyedra.AAC.1
MPQPATAELWPSLIVLPAAVLFPQGTRQEESTPSQASERAPVSGTGPRWAASPGPCAEERAAAARPPGSSGPRP